MSQLLASPLPPAAAASDFDAGVLEFADTLRAFIRKRVADPADAEDVAQDVFVRVFRARGTLRDLRKLRAWLYQTARGAIVDYYRRRRPREPLPADLTDDATPFDEVGERLRRSVRRFLATLPDHYRRPVLLADFRGQSVAAIARKLKLSETATKSRLARGRALLRKKLLACCSFEFDRFGRAIDLRPRHACECDCGDGASGTPGGIPIATRLAHDDDETAIRGLLAEAGLPTSDLTSAHLLNFVVADRGDRLIGCAGLEVFGTEALLRSVAVAPAWRGSGVGRRLVQEIEHVGRQLGVHRMHLLTTTAEHFFARLGYTRADRQAAPAAIRSTTEFSSLCPASSAFMRRTIPVLPLARDPRNARPAKSSSTRLRTTRKKGGSETV